MRIPAIVLVVLLACVTSGYAADHAVVILYHHVSTDTPPSTSVTPEVFRQHLEFLDREGFHVLPLSQVLQVLAAGKSVPDNTVCLTFDDAYRSVHDTAMPLLRERNWPFTVFVSTESIDRGFRNYLGWEELRELRSAGAEFGSHSYSHAHLVRHRAGESEQQWHDRVAEDIARALQRLAEELGSVTTMFAYPYGEHTPELQAVVQEMGLIGIAQESGALGYGFDPLAVPRFPMATNYADMNRFAVSVRSRPLPVTDVSGGPVIQSAGVSNHLPFEFTLLPGGYRPDGLACYSSSGNKLAMKRKGQEEGERVTVFLPDWGMGRQKINCTAPSATENGVFFWLSHLWLIQSETGDWYAE